jgi:hypothetical protein
MVADPESGEHQGGVKLANRVSRRETRRCGSRPDCTSGYFNQTDSWEQKMLNDRENILSALREKPLKVYEVMRRANIANEEACQSLLMKMRGEGLVKFDIHKGRWLIG